MAINPNQPLSGSNSADNLTRSGEQTQNGIVTVNNDRNPTPEQRDAQIPNELDTERIRSERQSVEEKKRSE